jgi:formate transporter
MKSIFLKALYAGLLIGIAAVAYLSVDNAYLGSLLFSFGLLMIVSSGYYLYTGKVGYWVKEKNYLGVLGMTLLGNILGTFIIGLFVRLMQLPIVLKTEALVELKLENGLFKVLLLSVLCGAMMYLGVEGYRKAKLETAKVLFVIFAVMIFILSKFEHSVANMAYYAIAGSYSIKSLIYLSVMIVGNGLGAMALCYIDSNIEKLDAKE